MRELGPFLGWWRRAGLAYGLGKGVLLTGRGAPDVIEDRSIAAPAKREQSWIAHT
jgi:hypothetical protein